MNVEVIKIKDLLREGVWKEDRQKMKAYGELTAGTLATCQILVLPLGWESRFSHWQKPAAGKQKNQQGFWWSSGTKLETGGHHTRNHSLHQDICQVMIDQTQSASVRGWKIFVSSVLQTVGDSALPLRGLSSALCTPDPLTAQSLIRVWKLTSTLNLLSQYFRYNIQLTEKSWGVWKDKTIC